jgi:hypothetical protein
MGKERKPQEEAPLTNVSKIGSSLEENTPNLSYKNKLDNNP